MAAASRPPRAASSGYLSPDTIAAVSTAVGGAISIVRVSGPGASDALARLAPEKGAHDAEPRKLYRATLRSASGEAIDDALFAFFLHPDSFTGEDMAEFHIHGGAITATLVMEALSAAGVRQALPGEFSFRAVRNGKMSLSQAQAVSDLVAASNEAAVSLALEKLSGSQNRLLGELAESLRRLATLAEAGIDFADQDLDEVSLGKLRAQVEPIRKTLAHLETSFDRGARIQEGIPVAFVGLPNAGKSSFFNALLGEDRSIVSDVAGTTRDVIRERLTLRGRHSSVTLRLEDTAGLRSAEDLVEKAGVERTRASVARAEVVLLIVDPGQPLDKLLEIWKALVAQHPRELPRRTVGVLTKIDAYSPTLVKGAHSNLVALGVTQWLQTSATTGVGVHEAASAIAAYCERLTVRNKGEVLLTRLDQVTAVRGAMADLHRATQASEMDLFAADLRQALHSLGPLIGETVPDDILGRIFSEFCIGK